ncbi:MAG: hypothetical protein UY06_C0002G0017 [Candidatus Amesbacteria bacterium GW2011_GWA2_47_70]|uniref:Uncharacterized protein n=1 Tax=Candidatus Amesbacteria bacterium GW2011_GWC2_45_19 TaxID=1618366 RepID=A0A0G1Q4E1_9BACT|nr:MAG: hypothetical protein UX05_C0001G0164 [Candidatus Amesbacteria bacterium GW2011_GWC2_45_19]KKU69482.1 MAG: hypothetical protein UX93_C0001G0067 [Microgenomates group bacterium GW2011_GWC1_47_20]KKU80304.1 MAG: hypothetical protein UY06_C0002G0017 [Candidatus Amesbacteria bacterium GW2011_GWA2_47_70]
MVKKLKFLVKLCLLWGGILAVYLLFSIYQDIRENKLLNYNDTYTSSEVEVKPEYKSDTTFNYVFKITSHDNYLGSITFKYFRLKGVPGQVIFRLREINRPEWYAENRYDFSYFNNDDNYSFGFPVVPDSKDKEFIVEFETVTQNLSQRLNYLDLKAAPILTAKYVFPRATVYKSPKLMASILLNRSVSVVDRLDLVRVGFITLGLAALSVIILNRQEPGGQHRIKIRPKDLQKNVQVLGYWTNKINPFFVPAGILVFLSIAFISGNFPLAERLAVYLWITLFGSAIFFVVQRLFLSRLHKLKAFITLVSINTISIVDDLLTKKLLILAGVLYIIISGLSSTYYLGGDDSRLFYVYPYEFLINYSSKIVSDTGVSQLTNLIPPPSLSAFVVILVGLKKILPMFNLQALLYSINIVGGFWAFYLLLSYLLRPESKHERVITALASFMYVFSMFNFYTIFNSRLVAEYLISLYPLSLLLGIKAIRAGKFYLLVLAVLIWSVFNFVSVTFPIFGAVLLTTLPLLILATWNYKKRLVMYLLGTGLLLGILNFHWLVFIPYTNLSQPLPGSSTPNLTSTEFREQNETGIKTVSEINNSFFPLLNSYHQKIQQNFHWPQLPIYNSWYLKFLPLGLVLIAVVIWAGITVEKDKFKIPLYVAAVANFVLAIYFFTVDIGPWGISLFLWLTNNIPGFVIFRNMYDKFAYAVSFQWALILAVSLSILIKSIKIDRHKFYLLFVTLLIAVINAKPFLLGEFEKLPYWTTLNSYDGIKAFNDDYAQLLNYIKNQETTGRYLSLPLLTGNSVIIEDQFQKNHYYAGVSPLLLLTGKNDLSGLISFSNKSTDVYRWIEKREYDNFGKLQQQLNTQYVIVNNSISTDLQSSFMFSDRLYGLQSPEFIASVLGPKIADFGRRYSLYEISPRYTSSKIYIADDPGVFANQRTILSYTKIASQEYRIKISQLSHVQTLVFLDPYLKGWQLRTPSGKVVFDNSHEQVFGYANSWKLDPLDIKVDLDKTDYVVDDQSRVGLDLRLYFQPYDYYVPSQTISVGAYLLAAVYVIWSFLKPKRAWRS